MNEDERSEHSDLMLKPTEIFYINVDDEKGVLNMNKRLFNKQKTELSLCKTKKELTD